MLRTTHRITALAAATALFALATTSAAARNLSITEQSFRITWNSMQIGGATATISCRVTLEGSFHSRTFAKVARSLVGAVSRAIIAHPCEGGEAWADNGTETQPLGRAPNTLPWHFTYEGFRGALPGIQDLIVLLSRVSFVIEATVLGFNCRGRYGLPEDNMSMEIVTGGSGGLVTVLPVAIRNRFSRVEQLGRNAVCPTTASFSGLAGIQDLSRFVQVSVTLI